MLDWIYYEVVLDTIVQAFVDSFPTCFSRNSTEFTSISIISEHRNVCGDETPVYHLRIGAYYHLLLSFLTPTWCILFEYIEYHRIVIRDWWLRWVLVLIALHLSPVPLYSWTLGQRLWLLYFILYLGLSFGFDYSLSMSKLHKNSVWIRLARAYYISKIWTCILCWIFEYFHNVTPRHRCQSHIHW